MPELWPGAVFEKMDGDRRLRAIFLFVAVDAVCANGQFPGIEDVSATVLVDAAGLDCEKSQLEIPADLKIATINARIR